MFEMQKWLFLFNTISLLIYRHNNNRIGKILALTIMFEVGDISRFAKVGNYSSYCRCVSSIRKSNDKKKGEGNRKNGNKYLSWAYVEAANFSRRYSEDAQKYYQRKSREQMKL